MQFTLWKNVNLHLEETTMMPSSIQQRLGDLRQFMAEHGLQAFVVPTTDPHASEYTPLHYESRKWLTGFSGSAGTAVVTLYDAALWTDSRYFIAAAEELRDTGIQLMKEGMNATPGIAQWLANQLRQGDCVGLDGMVNPVGVVQQLQHDLMPAGISVNCQWDPFESIWENRPPLPLDTIKVHPLQYAGEKAEDKTKRLRQRLSQRGCTGMLVSALDEIAWLLNLRGSDVHCTPVFVAYCLVAEEEVVLFADRRKISSDTLAYLSAAQIRLQEYSQIIPYLQKHPAGRMLFTQNVNASLYYAVEGHDIVMGDSPIAEMKAIKNPVECDGFRRAMERDGVALVQFLRWLKPAVQAGTETEISIGDKLRHLRSRQPLYQGLSFDTIAAYTHHGAIVHYEATPGSDIPLKPQGFLLLDSGAHYLDGTTDITRTIALGEPTQEEKFIYTLVLKGHIALSRCRFPSGSSGTQLDLAARYAMWQEGYNYGHGTGHGVGSFLCVHEGPHQIRMNYKSAPLSEGVIVTDEPGLYIEGKFGVRIENMLLCVPYKDSAFGTFVQFEPLTLCPIDTTPIDFSILTETERNWLNEYHAHVRDRLLPLLDDPDDSQWLIAATQPI